MNAIFIRIIPRNMYLDKLDKRSTEYMRDDVLIPNDARPNISGVEQPQPSSTPPTSTVRAPIGVPNDWLAFRALINEKTDIVVSIDEEMTRRYSVHIGIFSSSIPLF
jgi:hypothetical protein